MRSTVRSAPSLVAIVFATLLFFPLHASRAATPASGSISPAAPGPVDTDYAPVVAGTAVDLLNLEATCPPGNCDNYDLTVSLPQPAATYYQTMTAKLSLHYSWTSTLPTDLDIFAFSPAGAKHGPGTPDTSGTGASYEDMAITDPVDGVWHLRSVASIAPLPTGAHLTITLTVAARPTPTTPPPNPLAATWLNYPAPDNITPALGSSNAGQHGAGEPSLGLNWKSGRALYEAGNHTLRVTFNDTVTPATATWEDKRSPYSRVTLDPILYTDHLTGRTFASQLDGACSVTSFTDDDGDNWLPSQGCGLPAGPDHQTLGGGNFTAPAPATATYPHAVYYCSQAIASAICARSDDGGVTFGPGIPIYNLTQCGGLHGHVKVAPDGTAYVPNAHCNNNQAAIVSADGGVTWAIKNIPDSSANNVGGDPSIGIGADNTVYFGYVNADGHPRVSVSQDKGDHWTASVDVGTPFGTQNAEFPAAVSGDGDRAAFAYLGTSTPGDDQSADFTGTWHLYVAFSYDRGATWITSDATPTDPVQRGCIWNGGGSNTCRNLLDFMDAGIDKTGRVLVGYADGCTGACVTNPSQNTWDALATIARQAGGKGLLAAYDPTLSGRHGGKTCEGRVKEGVQGDYDCRGYTDLK